MHCGGRNPASLQIFRPGSPAWVSNRFLSAFTANDRRPPLPAIRDFVTWAPLLAILWGSQQGVDYAGGYVDGQGDYRGGFGWHMSPRLQHMSPPVGRAVAEQTRGDPVAPARRPPLDS